MDCKIYGCIKKQYASGLCWGHYEKQRIANAPPCKIDGCERKSAKVGMCERHYRQQKLAEAPLCSVEGCGRHQNANGLCTTHNMRIVRHGSLEADERAFDRGAREKHDLYDSWYWFKRKDRLCLEWLEDFWSMVRTTGDRPTPTSRLYRTDEALRLGPDNWQWREPVGSTKEKSAYQRAWRRKNAERAKWYSLRKQFGIEWDEYQGLIKLHNGLCAICNQPETAKTLSGVTRDLAVDHCHKTGKIRGLLCTGCNMTVGHCDKHPELIDGLIAYLEKHRNEF